MRIILIFVPYILVPLILALFSKKFNLKNREWTYIISGIIILIYPFVLFWFDDLLNPPPQGPRCGNPQIGFFLGNIVLFFLMSLLLQLIFNKLFLNAKNNS
jgi:hypothetical protein